MDLLAEYAQKKGKVVLQKNEKFFDFKWRKDVFEQNHRSGLLRQFRILLLMGIIWAGMLVPLAASELSDAIHTEMERIRSGERLVVEGSWLAMTNMLPRFYESRNFEPAWQNTRTVEELLNSIDDIANDGLRPSDYHITALKKMYGELQQGRLNATQTARFDLLCSDALLLMAHHLAFGRVPQGLMHTAWNFAQPVSRDDFLPYVQNGLARNGVAGMLRQLLPQHPDYVRLRDAMSRYRRNPGALSVRGTGGGTPLRAGARGPRVTQLGERLVASGDLAAPVPETMDARMIQALKNFQRRHNMEADGVAGPRTLEALNMPPEAPATAVPAAGSSQRINKMRVNLERMRWFLRNVPKQYILVDVAGYMAYLMKDGHVLWSSRVQVGRPQRQTPALRSQIDFLVVNPTWTVPPTIIAEDTVPAMMADPGYLARRNIQVLDRQGRPVNPGSINWASYRNAKGKFPYLLRQEPGPRNALGRIKFIFPNSHSVYLHDTPNRGGFSRGNRGTSSGCVRIDRPFELADLLLKSPAASKNLRAVLATNKTKNINLSEPMPIMLFYWTAQAGPDGSVIFKNDIYGRDSALLEEMNKPVQVERNYQIPVKVEMVPDVHEIL